MKYVVPNLTRKEGRFWDEICSAVLEGWMGTPVIRMSENSSGVLRINGYIPSGLSFTIG